MLLRLQPRSQFKLKSSTSLLRQYERYSDARSKGGSYRSPIFRVTMGFQTDFWRKIDYGFIRDSGHFYYQEYKGDFMAVVKITISCSILVICVISSDEAVNQSGEYQ